MEQTEGVSDREESITKLSDLRPPHRRIWIVTTASLPWRTGTSVNPLARALYLARGRPKNFVTILLPWLTEREDQRKLFGDDQVFNTMQEQEDWIRKYCRERVEDAENLRIRFYPAVYHEAFGSIFATVDICALIPKSEADVAILEEPEHLTWFRVPPEMEDTITDGDSREIEELGWAAKFNHVVGILHTNYSAYLDQYGMGSSFIAGTALGLLSSVVVRAYCHRLIRLSGTLPELAKSKETTANVHGVRSEFFVREEPQFDAGQHTSSPIYFIGKIIWAKGFDKLLETEDKYRNKTGRFFPIDIYGKGNDEEAIKRAFFGRQGIATVNTKRETEASQLSAESSTDQTAADLFRSEGSLRRQVDDRKEGDLAGIAFAKPPTQQVDSLPNPLEILGDISTKTMDMGITTLVAGGKISEKLFDLAFHAVFSKKVEEDGTYFDPPQSKFELRKHPIPGRFLGVKDHAMLRDDYGHKIFLNPSETEVLCTTTAEALAMGKFVIIPKHPSNDFFQQFPNCLMYSSEKECLEKIQWALDRVPQPLTPEQKYQLTWEGATERLFAAAAQEEAEVEQRKGDMNLARLHIESAKKGHFIHTFLTNRQPKSDDK